MGFFFFGAVGACNLATHNIGTDSRCCWFWRRGARLLDTRRAVVDVIVAARVACVEAASGASGVTVVAVLRNALVAAGLFMDAEQDDSIHPR